MKRSAFVILLSSLALAACTAQEQPQADEVPQVEEQAAPVEVAPVEAAPAPADTAVVDSAAAPAPETEEAHSGEGSH